MQSEPNLKVAACACVSKSPQYRRIDISRNFPGMFGMCTPLVTIKGKCASSQAVSGCSKTMKLILIADHPINSLHSKDINTCMHKQNEEELLVFKKRSNVEVK